MPRPIFGQNYPRSKIPVLDQEYPRWNNLFSTMNFDDKDSLRRIFQAAGMAENFHPFNLKLNPGTKLSDAEMTAVRDLSYTFIRNYLCRDMVRHLILFSRHDDQDFTLEKETRFYTKMLQNTKLNPISQPEVYLQVRREFCRLAPDLDDLDENEAKEELNRWASWGSHKIWGNELSNAIGATGEKNNELVYGQAAKVNLIGGKEAVRVGNVEQAGIYQVIDFFHETMSVC